MYFTSSASCILCSIFNYKTKTILLQRLNEFDFFIEYNFDTRIHLGQLKRSLQIRFLLFFCETMSGSFFFMISSYLSYHKYFYYSCSMALLTQITHMQSFYFYQFVRAVEERLKAISSIDLNAKQKRLGSIAKVLFTYKKSMIKICDIIDLTQQTFSPSLRIVIVLLYFTMVTNFYWIGLSLLGIGYAQIKDAIIIVSPNLVIILTLALCEHNFKKHLINIKGKLMSASFCNNQSEEISVFMLSRNFTFSFIGFSTFADVSIFEKLQD